MIFVFMILCIVTESFFSYEFLFYKSFSHSIHSKVLSETQANIFVDCAESLCNGVNISVNISIPIKVLVY